MIGAVVGARLVDVLFALFGGEEREELWKLE
jgi:hypothetical protein